jgi:hypothetical protein
MHTNGMLNWLSSCSLKGAQQACSHQHFREESGFNANNATFDLGVLGVCHVSVAIYTFHYHQISNTIHNPRGPSYGSQIYSYSGLIPTFKVDSLQASYFGQDLWYACQTMHVEWTRPLCTVLSICTPGAWGKLLRLAIAMNLSSKSFPQKFMNSVMDRQNQHCSLDCPATL